MRHEPTDVICTIAGIAEHALDHVGDCCHRVAKDLTTFHAQASDGLGRGRPAIDIELVLVAAVRAQTRGQDAAIVARAGLLLGFEYDRTGTVAEQDTRGAILPLEDTRERL